MPRPGPRRIPLSIRIDPDHAEWLVKEAERRGVSQGAIIRELIAGALPMPTGIAALSEHIRRIRTTANPKE